MGIESEAGFIHDLANPLTIVESKILRVLKNTTDEAIKEDLKKALNATERAVALVKERREFIKDQN